MLGAGEGLLTNLCLVLGVAGAASTDAATVRLAGVAGLLAGASPWRRASSSLLGHSRRWSKKRSKSSAKSSPTSRRLSCGS